ncbi:MAG TPA: glycosyl hydrolase family 39 [Candidatus Sulfotelmatobacter sp.]|nr:glycosyl hydrolase family 39 [Candidatus Sulfotelmatobacter sp.]
MKVRSRSLLLLLAFCPLSLAVAQVQLETVTIDAQAQSHPLPHFWEHMFGSGRAILSLRESYREDLRHVKAVTGMQYVRFHAIFDDEVGVYDEDAQGKPVFNFSYVDQIYDGLLQNGVRPFVELSFMPKKLAAKDILHAFWYKQNVSPPKDYAKWDEMITQFTRHLVDRYGIDEVSQWYFEVWNEPNIDFWAGVPKQPTYFELYDHTARAIKAVSSKLRVGGPATAQAAWADDFIRHCAENKVPVDFVSSHVYGNDKAEDVFGTHEQIPRDRMVCRAIDKVHRQIQASAMPNLPLIWSEFNASYANEPDVTDAAYMGPWLADTIRQCDGLVDEMSYWTFSDVFEEQGVVKQPFYGGYGLIAEDGLPKPAFNAFLLLHRLGDQRLAVSSEDVLTTKRQDGSLVIAAWNLTGPGPGGSAREIELHFSHANVARAQVRRVDQEHGDLHKVYAAMGSPRYPTQQQIQILRDAARLSPPEYMPVAGGSLRLNIPPEGLVLIDTEPAH